MAIKKGPLEGPFLFTATAYAAEKMTSSDSSDAVAFLTAYAAVYIVDVAENVPSIWATVRIKKRKIASHQK